MNKKIITLGGGLVGFPMAVDLVKSGYLVTVADRDESLKEKLEPYNIDFLPLDFTDLDAVLSMVQDFDLVIGSVPGFMGYQMRLSSAKVV